MKALNKILAVATAGLLLTGCNDLDTAPMGSTITNDQKNAVYTEDPSMLEAGVNSIATMFTTFANTLGDGYHNDFGYPSVMLCLDSRGYDFVSEAIGYNWYSSSLKYSDNTKNGSITYMIWRTMYNQVYTANTVLKSISADTQDPTEQYYRAQALAVRAFDYFVLAQLYQHNYVGHENSLCVPLVLDTNMDKIEADGGSPRKTVEEVYTQILSDINNAVSLLENSSIKPSAGRAGKKFVSLATAYGVRARINLTMQKWAEAAADAQAALNNTTAVPYSAEEVSKPTFASADDNAWMWGVIIEEGDDVVTSGIINWPSHMGSLNYGYASVGAWRMASKALYNSIPETDPRKGWFLNEEFKSANLTEAQQAYIGAKEKAYIQVKFAPYKDEIYTSTNANDVPLMRVEEMYLILAEAQAMAGNPGLGAQTLQTFVQTYRDKTYTCTASSPTDVQMAVYDQRRLEFWGEGLAYFDIMRLGIGVDRRGAGFASNLVFDIEGNDPILIYPIPQSEEEANSLLGENNPVTSVPSPVADVE